MSMQALRERLAALNKEANQILAEKGSQVWSAEDKAKFDTAMDEAERVKSQLEATQRAMDLDAEANFRDVKKKPKKGEESPQDAAIREGFEIYLRKGTNRLTAEEAQMVRNTMSTTTASQGGSTVMPIVASDLIDLLKGWGWMRAVASQQTTENGADLSYPTSDGTAEIGELIAQNTIATLADPSFGTRAVNAYKFGSKTITVPIELLQDTTVDLVGLLMTRMRDRIGRIQNQKFTVGTGTAEPFGLIAATTAGKVGLTGQTLTVIYDDLVDLIDSLDAAYLDIPSSTPEMPNVAPGWMFNQASRRVIRKLKDTAGRPLWTPSYDAGIGGRATTPDMLLGYPVYINNDVASMAANAFSIAFGNFHKYLIRDAMEMQIFRFDDSAFMTKGQIGYLAWARAGGNLLDINSVRLYQNSAT